MFVDGAIPHVYICILYFPRLVKPAQTKPLQTARVVLLLWILLAGWGCLFWGTLESVESLQSVWFSTRNLTYYPQFGFCPLPQSLEWRYIWHHTWLATTGVICSFIWSGTNHLFLEHSFLLTGLSQESWWPLWEQDASETRWAPSSQTLLKLFCAFCRHVCCSGTGKAGRKIHQSTSSPEVAPWCQISASHQDEFCHCLLFQPSLSPNTAYN